MIQKKSVIFPVSLPWEVYEKLGNAASAKNISKAAYIRMLISTYWEKSEGDDGRAVE